MPVPLAHAEICEPKKILGDSLRVPVADRDLAAGSEPARAQLFLGDLAPIDWESSSPADSKRVPAKSPMSPRSGLALLAEVKSRAPFAGARMDTGQRRQTC